MPSDQLQPGSSQERVLSRLAGVPGLAAKLAPLGKMRDLYRRVQQSSEGFRLENLLAEMRIDIRVDRLDHSRIPATGPVLAVANHPYGVLDGGVLTALLTRVRPDVKILTNSLLGDVPELQQHCIYVDPFQTDRSVEANRTAVRQALTWLHRGGMLAMFPAGEVSHWQMPAAHIADPEWNDTAVRLIRHTGAAALPMYFCGHNRVGFHVLGVIHPKLRTAFLLQEFLQKQGKTVEVRVGSPIAAESIVAFTSDREAIDYLRWRTYLLARRNRRSHAWVLPRVPLKPPKSNTPLAASIDSSVLACEMANLPAERRLAESGDFAVYLAKAEEVPNLLLEVGRLRELTFRRVGEGTGRARDLDSFDRYYWHILLWNQAKCELAGGYRAGETAEILNQQGVPGLYTSTLFRYDPSFFQKLGPAFELGRSFVRLEYQRHYAPLLLLWKGIARLIAMRPEIPVLFGAVSISNDYSKASREMIYHFFEDRMQDDELAGMVEPRRPFRPGFLRQWDCRSMCHAFHDLEELSEPITDVESDGKGLPILLRQYAKIGGRLLGFNVDRKFSNVLDGLVMVDLRNTDAAVLDRYMGREAARKFREMHSSAAVR